MLAAIAEIQEFTNELTVFNAIERRSEQSCITLRLLVKWFVVFHLKWKLYILKFPGTMCVECEIL